MSRSLSQEIGEETFHRTFLRNFLSSGSFYRNGDDSLSGAGAFFTLTEKQSSVHVELLYSTHRYATALHSEWKYPSFFLPDKGHILFCHVRLNLSRFLRFFIIRFDSMKLKRVQFLEFAVMGISIDLHKTEIMHQSIPAVPIPPPGNSGAFSRTFHPGGRGISLPSNYPGAFDHLTSFTSQHYRFF